MAVRFKTTDGLDLTAPPFNRDSSIDMLCFLDFSGYFKRLNPAWERTLGFTREELMSKPFIECVHPDDLATRQRNSATASSSFKKTQLSTSGRHVPC